MQYYSPVQQNWESMTSVKPQPSFAAAESRMFSLSQWGINHFPHLCHIFLVFSFCKNTKWNFNFLLKSCNNGWSSSIIWRFSLYFCVLPEKNICYKKLKVEFCIVSLHLQYSLLAASKYFIHKMTLLKNSWAFTMSTHLHEGNVISLLWLAIVCQIGWGGGSVSAPPWGRYTGYHLSGDIATCWHCCCYWDADT